MDIGRVRPINIEDEMRGAYLDYAMSVITARALPDVRDGLKPVQRRILYAMDELSLRHTSPYKKSARIVGEVLGKYHPHGDAPVYETMVRMAQDFSMRYLLIDGQGNFGSVDGDPPAAMRYTEARLAAIAEEMLADIDKNTVDFAPNFDGSLKEPTVLPAKVPNLLLNGSAGIAVGMATNIPPHNLNEVSDALIHMINQFGQAVDGGIPFTLLWSRIFGATVDSNVLADALKGLKPDVREKVKAEAAKASKKVTDEVRAQALLNLVDDMIDIPPDKLMEFIKGPDFPTAGIILGEEGIKSAYTTGHGRITIRAKAHVEEMRGGRHQIIVTQLPFQVNKAALQEKIAELVRDKRVEGISELRDESDRQGMRVVIELKRETQPKQVLNQLYKYTSMQGTFSINMLALVDGQPRVLTLKMVLLHYLNFRKEIITRRTLFDLERARHRAHILEGLKIALDHLDEVIATIRKSRDAEAAKSALMKNFKLTEIQAQAILDMQLRRLAALERQKILDELAETLRLIKYLEDLLANPGKILYLIRDELTELKTKYGDARRTKIVAEEVTDFTEEDLVPDEPIMVAISSKNYVKRMPADTYRLQRRGKGIAGTIAREDDPIQILAPANTLDQVLFFSNRGRAFQVKSYDLPDVGRQARGLPVSNFVSLQPDERIVGAIAVRNFDQAGYAVFLTASGDVKRVSLSEYSSARSSGIIGLSVAEGDEVIWAGQSEGKGQILAVTRQGQAIRFSEEDVRASGRTSGGVRAIKLGSGDVVVDADNIRDEQYLAVVTSTGLGKRSPLEEFPVQGRGGGGVRVANIGEKTGLIVGAKAVNEADEIAISCAQGTVFRTLVEGMPLKGRALQVAQIVALDKGDSVTSLLRIQARGDGRTAPTGNGGAPTPDGGETPPSNEPATKRTKLPNKANARATSEKPAKGKGETAKESASAAKGKPASKLEASTPKSTKKPGHPGKGKSAPTTTAGKKVAPPVVADVPVRQGRGKASRDASHPTTGKTPSKPNKPVASATIRPSSGHAKKSVEAKPKAPATPKTDVTARPSVSKVVTATSRTKSVNTEKAAEKPTTSRIILAPTRAEQAAVERSPEVAKNLEPNKARSSPPRPSGSEKSKPRTLLGSIATTLGKTGGEKKGAPGKKAKEQPKGKEKQGKLPL